jgi:hypothetical protein
MGRFVDSVITYRILRILTTPFIKTEAYKLGIIDENGKELKKMSSMQSVAERDAYTILHRMIYRIKRIIERVPVANKQIITLAAALSLIKEHTNTNNEPIDIEIRYLDRLKSNLTEEVIQVNSFINEYKTLTFKQFVEEAPANNAAATPGIDGFTPDTIGVKKRKKSIIYRRGLPNVT